MGTITIVIILVALGIWVEKRFSPRLSFKNSECTWHYTAKKGSRNVVKLFDL